MKNQRQSFIPKHLILLLFVGFALMGCFKPEPICQCSQELNLTLKIQDGTDGTCLSSVGIYINDIELHPSQIVEKDSCALGIGSGMGDIAVSIKKNGYNLIKLNPINIQYYEDNCCGVYDRKSISIKWYKSSLNQEPEISVK